jgi:hypothetical protein
MAKPEIVCLGFAYGDSDRIRLNHFKSLNPQYDIIAVNVASQPSVPTNAFYNHRDASFSTTRGFKRALNSNTSIVLLDYFWLQPHWYRESYGPSWAKPNGQID